jgi:hypothetical protein
MMQCATCNKSFLFAPRLKTLKNKETTNIIMEQDIFSKCSSWSERHLFLPIWNWNPFNVFEFKYKFEFNLIKSKFNSNSTIGLKFNWIDFKFN